MIKGDKVKLIPATLADRQNVYDWCFRSETTKSHSGPPDFPDIPIATYEQFCDTYYVEYYFTGAKPQDGRGFLIISGEEPVGFISYSCFHLKPDTAEFDIWMNSEANCGKGFGVDALVALGGCLHQTMGICELIIASSTKNIRAVRAYEKAGFVKSRQPMRDFLLDEYIPLYGEGDYGTDGTALLVKRLE